MKLFQRNHDIIRAVAVDIDGTLVDEETGIVPDSAVLALKKIRKKGIRVFICTGRNKAEIDKPLRDMGWDGMVLLNGRLVYNREGDVVWNNCIPQQETDGLLDLIKAHYFPVCFVGNEQIFINQSDGTLEQMGNKPDYPGVVPARTLDDVYGLDIYNAAVYLGPQHDDDLKRVLKSCKIERLGPTILSIEPQLNDKRAGMTELLKYCTIPRTRLLFIGDGPHDTGLMRYAGYSAAMGSADETVKSAAGYVTADVMHNGLEQAFRHFRLIR